MLIKSEADTDPKFGCAPLDRPISSYLEFGFINLDKPSGPTSHQVAEWVRNILNAKRCGHSGTLDPHVTGVLPTAINSATKVLSSLLIAGKEYVGIMHLHEQVPEAKLHEVVETFKGKIRQKPPVRSSVKREWRTRTIYTLNILEIHDRDILFKTSVEAGTYIRKLCHDIGLELGGAHMAELRRTRAGPFFEKGSKTLQELADAVAIWKEEGNEELLREVVRPVEKAVTHLKKLYVKDGAIEAICCGANLSVAGISKVQEEVKKNEQIAVMTLKDELVCLAEALMTSEEMMEAKKGWAADIKRVIMSQGTYPKMWKTKDSQG